MTDFLAARDTWTMANCSIDRALSVVGTRSAILVMREAFFGTRRFDDFARRVGIGEISRTVAKNLTAGEEFQGRRVGRAFGFDEHLVVLQQSGLERSFCTLDRMFCASWQGARRMAAHAPTQAVCRPSRMVQSHRDSTE